MSRDRERRLGTRGPKGCGSWRRRLLVAVVSGITLGRGFGLELGGESSFEEGQKKRTEEGSWGTQGVRLLGGELGRAKAQRARLLEGLEKVSRR